MTGLLCVDQIAEIVPAAGSGSVPAKLRHPPNLGTDFGRSLLPIRDSRVHVEAKPGRTTPLPAKAVALGTHAVNELDRQADDPFVPQVTRSVASGPLLLGDQTEWAISIEYVPDVKCEKPTCHQGRK